jgi:hypothetical protein
MQVFYYWVSMHDEKGGAVLSSDEVNPGERCDVEECGDPIGQA